ncbi:MAG: hypothetical protein RLZZ135_582 [Cyanobacteriota bacterium]|jgi:hypothetical protein
MHLILYSKVGCHLCEGLQEKLAQIEELDLQLEIREITANPDWFDRYQYEIPVLYLQVDGVEKLIPRFSPRASVPHVQQMLQQYSNGLPSATAIEHG